MDKRYHPKYIYQDIITFNERNHGPESDHELEDVVVGLAKSALVEGRSSSRQLGVYKLVKNCADWNGSC